MSNNNHTIKEMSVFDYLLILHKRQLDEDALDIAYHGEHHNAPASQNVRADHSDFPIPVLSALLRLDAIKGTHAYGFKITQEGIDLITKMYPNTIEE